ncbi:unnamed protein product [Musa acuminata subsp. malaccensis]|uniref:(wild Malaysian banana) hypothetical protein n=1 Tax=Musa acuminata subsp. malaccensis TaxID=214687 RepID=A0A804IPF9_MUSAM|nr:PREDICTED: myb family transcription factor EFM-like [Musa acuminata subsp. malaccensis]CAG1842088.1 unnamed protein product [Musa acuminata subsp. malaccensis]
MILDRKEMENARRFQELIDALDEERRKVEVFHRELPLCLHLINQTIESYRQRLMVRDLTLSHELAEKEWISLRPSSMSSEVSGSKQQHPWPRMATKSWGDSQSSDKEQDAAAPITGPAGREGDDNGGTDGEKKEKFRHRRRKMRRYWTEDLHERFLHALEQLGGCHAATPKQIRKLMEVDELTGDEIKSHLQKFRIQSRRTSSMHHSSSNTSSADFVVVRGIWIPTPEYSSICMAADEAAAHPGQVADTPETEKFAPVANEQETK